MSLKPYQKTIQIHPRVLAQEKQCCDCTSFVENIDPMNSLGWCSNLNEMTMKYDECGTFVRASPELSSNK